MISSFLATGSQPKRLAVPGAELEGVFTVSDLNEAVAIKRRVAEGRVEKGPLLSGQVPSVLKWPRHWLIYGG